MKQENATVAGAADAMKAHAEAAAEMLKQLANSHRLLILCQLIGGEKSVGELCETIDLSQSAVSQHLAKLRESGIVGAEKRGQMVYYRLCSMEVHALLSTLYLIYCRP
ncbi:ArsR/SmtB family transcription factor [Rhodomicrobium sp.]|jgi:DNA-binding transcriptional ArsR family regulator|uniref:ArsR/SmtB family transcription factor n=1 Tax=Rhodomicrobium sp. TaxID=2720632 RepID=UPI0039E48CCB